MQSLELKIPPPIVAVIIGAGMWLLARVTPAVDMPSSFRLGVAIFLVLVGIGTALAGVIILSRAKTTLNPFDPAKTASFVTAGIFRRTRNPMYLGLLLFLAAWAVYLSAPLALLGLPAFVLYINRFQIEPEERVLAEKFGAEFAAYRQKVRRWL